jgi:hypothetical protein
LKQKQIVAKYYGKEGQLAGKLQRRYGEAPRIPYLRPPTPQQPQPPAQRPSPGSSGGGGGDDNGGGSARAPRALPPPPSSSKLPPPPQPPSNNDACRADITSPHFDPLFALTTTDVRLPVPETEAPPLDNLSRCRHLLPHDDPEYVALVPLDPAAAAAARRGAFIFFGFF